METPVRNTGIGAIGGAPWGTHFCQFYQTKQDLIDTLVPYFRAGLEDNEFCMWITAEPLREDEALQTLRNAMPDVDRHLQNGQLEILPHSEWYLKDGAFDSQRVLSGWVSRLERALARGYDGLRLSGNTFWLEKEDWRDFTDYEHEIDSIIGNYRMLALCTYSLDRCGPYEIIDVIRNHQFALIKREGQWETIESGERKRARAERERLGAYLRLLLESTDQGIYSLDLNHRCTLVNRAAAQMLGYEPEALLGYHVHELIHYRRSDGSPYPVAECPMARTIKSGEGIRVGDEVFWRRDGTPFPVEYSSYPLVEHGRLLGAVVIFVDISERKRAEAERERLLAQLSKTNEQREDFIRTISHDLRNPLSAASGHAQLLQRVLSQKGMEREASSAQLIITATRRLNTMIQDLVESIRMESSQLQLELRPTDLVGLVADLCCRVGTPEDQARLVLEHAEWVPLTLADPERLERALANLITNALKYSPADKPVLVRVEPRDNQNVVSVTDQGPGIPPEERGRVFERFYRAQGGGQGEGLGLGLYISRLIVEAHGGRVWVESQVGKGSAFYLSLPIAHPPEG